MGTEVPRAQSFPRQTLSAAHTGILLMLVAALTSSILHMGVRHVSPRIPVFEVVFLRTLFSMLAGAPLVLRPGRMAWRSNAPGLQIVRGLVGTLSMTTWYYSLATLPLADAVTLGLTTSLFVVLGATIVFKERAGLYRWAALLVGFLGAVIVLRPTGQGVALVPAIICIASSALWAISLLIAKYAGRYDSSLTTAFWQPLTIMPFAAIGAYVTWVPPQAADLTVLAVIAAVAVLGNYCSIQALRIADTSITMPVDYTKLIWSIIGGYILFNEIPSVSTALGALLIIASSLYIALRESHRGPQQ